MSGDPKRKPSPKPTPHFDVKDWVTRTTAFAVANPHMAHRAYAAAAARIRKEAEGHPQGEAMRTLAAQLDALSTKARTEQALGAVHVKDYGEPVFGDPLEEEHHELGVEIAHMEAAMSAEPTVESDSFREALAQQAGAAALKRADVEPVRINPWSAQFGTTMFGNSQVVQYTNYTPASGTFTPYLISTSPRVIAPMEAPVVQWQGKDDETTVITVAVGRGITGVFPPTNPPPIPAWPLSGQGVYRPNFHMFWGSGQGQPNEVFGDVGRGVQFTVACSRLFVNVGMDPPPSGATSQSGFPGAMQLSGQMGFFSAARRSPVVRTMYIDNIAANTTSSSGQYVIPPFATRIENILGLNPAVQFTFVLRDVGGNVTDTVNPLTDLPLTLDGESYEVLVTNITNATASCRIVFGLSL